MKSFSKQFCECEENGLLVPTFYSFEEHPELLPLPYKKSILKMIKDIKNGKLKGLTLYHCGKFNNGRCSSGNVECKKLRNNE